MKLLNFNIRYFCEKFVVGRTNLTHLTDRSILIINGPESYKVLQGITTNNLQVLQKKQKRMIHSLFLTAKGKIVADCFIHRPLINLNGKIVLKEQQLWIDVHKSVFSELKTHINKFTWKRDLQLIDCEKQPSEVKPQIYAGYNNIYATCSEDMLGTEAKTSNLIEQEGVYANSIIHDPRNKNFGVRIICNQQTIELDDGQFIEKNLQNYYNFMRMYGICQIQLIRGKLPFQFNYDLINAINFDKGCCLGNQIISRAYFTGILRRRIFPFQVQEGQERIEEKKLLLTVNGEQIGKIIYYKDKIGLALVNYLKWIESDKKWPLWIASPFKGFLLSPYHEKLKAYYLHMKQKQKILSEFDL